MHPVSSWWVWFDGNPISGCMESHNNKLVACYAVESCVDVIIVYWIIRLTHTYRVLYFYNEKERETNLEIAEKYIYFIPEYIELLANE